LFIFAASVFLMMRIISYVVLVCDVSLRFWILNLTKVLSKKKNYTFKFSKMLKIFFEYFAMGAQVSYHHYNLVLNLISFLIIFKGVHIHEKSQKQCTVYALRIFDFYLERNPSLKKNLILSIVLLFSFS